MDTLNQESYLCSVAEDIVEGSTEAKNDSPFKRIISGVVMPITLYTLVYVNRSHVTSTHQQEIDLIYRSPRLEITNSIDMEFEKIISKIRSYANYEDNWDGYDGIAANDNAIENTILFLKKLPYNIIKPRPGLSGDGEIGLFWDKSDFFIDVGFLGENKYSYYAKDSENREYYGNEINIDEEISPDLINIISV